MDNIKHHLLCNVAFENEWLCSEVFFSQGKWPNELASEDRRTLLFSIPSRDTLYENGSGPMTTNMNGESLFSGRSVERHLPLFLIK